MRWKTKEPPKVSAEACREYNRCERPRRDAGQPNRPRTCRGREFEALDARFLSGTEWEYFDALQAADSTGKPQMLVYRRTEKQLLDQDDSGFDAKREQWKLVKTFFDAFRNPDGSLRRGYYEYATPTAFEHGFERHLRDVLKGLLKAPAPPDAPASPGKMELVGHDPTQMSEV